MSEKVKMVRCKDCKCKDYKDNLIRNSFTMKNGKKVFTYHHRECLDIKDNADLNKKKMYENEAEVHKKSKMNLHYAIVKHNTVLVDQFRNEYQLEFDYSAVESPVIKEYVDKLPFVDKETCDTCIRKCLGHENSYEHHKGKIRKVDVISNSSTKKNVISFKEHPCGDCVFNQNLNYVCLFDIGFMRNGVYSDAIEIKNTTEIKRHKLIYCIKNNIRLFEIGVRNEDTIPKDIDKVYCKLVWWKEDNVIKVIDEYRDILRDV